MKLTVKRLDHNQGVAWAAYFVLEQRCLRFIERHQIDFDPGMFRNQLRSRFIDEVQERHRMIVFVDEQGQIRGHFLAWLDVNMGRPYIHVNQLEVDEGYTLSDVREEMFEKVDTWIDRVNRTLPTGAPRVDVVSFWTWHSPEVFERYLRVGCDLKISRYVLEYKRSERKRKDPDAAILEQSPTNTRH